MIALVTGATSGFGAEMTHKFTKTGHQVIPTGRRKDRPDHLAAKLGACVAAYRHSTYNI